MATDIPVVYGTECELFNVQAVVGVWKSTIGCRCDARPTWYIPLYPRQSGLQMRRSLEMAWLDVETNLKTVATRNKYKRENVSRVDVIQNRDDKNS